jgi:co-chaperonin GroES (HSP10)
MKAVLGRVALIRPEVPKKKSVEGFMLTDKASAKMVYQEGVVVRVGSDVDPGLLEEGDRILYNRVSGHDLNVNNETLRVIPVREGEAIFILEEGDTTS